MGRRPNTNVVTHAGTRRSETKVKHPYDGMSFAQIQRKTEENNPQFPGMHCVVVPKLNQQDPKMASPIGWYEGQGYKELSADPLVTGSAADVIMGIDIDTWIKREQERVKEGNDLMHGLIDETDEAMREMNGSTPGLIYFGEQSGITRGTPISVSPALPDDEE